MCEESAHRLMVCIKELREAVGLFAGAMPISPKEAFDEALERVKADYASWAQAEHELLHEIDKREMETRRADALQAEVMRLIVVKDAVVERLTEVERLVHPLREALEWALDLLDVNDRLIKSRLPRAWASLNQDSDRRAKNKARSALADVFAAGLTAGDEHVEK